MIYESEKAAVLKFRSLVYRMGKKKRKAQRSYVWMEPVTTQAPAVLPPINIMLLFYHPWYRCSAASSTIFIIVQITSPHGL